MRIHSRENRFWNPSVRAWKRAAVAIALVSSTLGTAFFPGCVLETERKGPVILFMGNSITLNAPAPDLKWYGTWGMAASVPEKDYLHQTVELLKEKGMAVEPHVGERNCVPCDGGIDEQAQNREQIRRLRPRYVVVQLSEHSFEIELKSGKMKAQYISLLKMLHEEGVPRVYCLGAWGERAPDELRGTAIQAALSGFPEYRFVDISPIVRDSANYGDPAAFTDLAVLWHPGDRGMRALAETVSAVVWADR
jgi:hypothetical protein